MTHELPPLPFDPAMMVPFCSAETFSYHHGKHHATYVNKLNEALQGSPLAELPLEEVIRRAHLENNKPVYNNAAQHFNHSFFWNCLSPAPTATPSAAATPGPRTLELLNRDYGSVDKFMEEFTKAASGLFGSGWVWLVLDADKLVIVPMKDADSPLIQGLKPLLTLDIWEHAYYIDHRNRRPDYISEFWNFLNWDQVERQLSL